MQVAAARTVDVSWRESGLCFGTYDERFFAGARPETRTRQPGISLRRIQKEAESICTGCPVLTDCRIYADTLDVTAGTWGGRTR